MPPTSTGTRRRSGGSASLGDALPNDGQATGDQQPTTPAPEPPAARVLPSLPTEKTTSAGVLEDKMILLYGPAGIGKSTLSSEFAGGNMFFFDTAGELSDLEVYRGPVTSWVNFKEWAASVKADLESADPRFRGSVIDTADMLGTFCAQFIRAKLGIAHESDADWGKGWSMVREEFGSAIAKLAAMPGGVILVSHSKVEEVKKPNRVINVYSPTLTGGVRDACINMADLVLFVDWANEEEGDRVIYTKPSQYHVAKERGKTTRLPAEIAWPVGESGWDVLRRAWYGE